MAKIKAMVEAKAITWDVIDVDTATGLQGCAEGALETIDWAKLGLDRSKFIGGDLLGLRCSHHRVRHGIWL